MLLRNAAASNTPPPVSCTTFTSRNPFPETISAMSRGPKVFVCLGCFVSTISAAAPSSTLVCLSEGAPPRSSTSRLAALRDRFVPLSPWSDSLSCSSPGATLLRDAVPWRAGSLGVSPAPAASALAKSSLGLTGSLGIHAGRPRYWLYALMHVSSSINGLVMSVVCLRRSKFCISVARRSKKLACSCRTRAVAAASSSSSSSASKSARKA
mmetsp:Transcript_25441/g.48067  ORF Transcript_25441/g.48067 Transcript_25441/m.48067 type:complete len:210 (-) Transcript_25441:445-1074(-)